MGYAIVGLFIHSDAADLAAAQLRDEYAKWGAELDILMPAFAGDMPRPATDLSEEGRPTEYFSSYRGAASATRDMDPIALRWGDRVRAGDWAVVTRSNDPEEAEEIARSMREYGAHRVDVIPH